MAPKQGAQTKQHHTKLNSHSIGFSLDAKGWLSLKNHLGSEQLPCYVGPPASAWQWERQKDEAEETGYDFRATSPERQPPASGCGYGWRA